MRLTRRSMLGACAGALPALAAEPVDASEGHGSLGLVIHSFAVRTSADRGRPSAERFSDAARFLDHAHALKVNGIQVGLARATIPRPTPFVSALVLPQFISRVSPLFRVTRPTWRDLRPRSVRRSVPARTL